ncbi:MAG: CBS domain-containing protein [Halobacteriovoraceae bacterium]|nr:CBS domain-containing protein [Halobacteriovoraceae bacterium]
MAFFILSKGKLSQIDFQYLQNPGGSRLDDTIVPGHGRGPVVVKNKVQKEAQNAYAIEVMSKPVITLPENAMAEKALGIFKKEKIHHLVLTKNDEVKGLVSSKDLAFLTTLELESYAMASQFMSSMILVCDEETPVDHLARVMIKEDISAIPVVDKEQFLTGIVTHHDLLRWIFE